jgi:hypothetical protein
MHEFEKHLLNLYSVIGIGLPTGKLAVNMSQNFCAHGTHFLLERWNLITHKQLNK